MSVSKEQMKKMGFNTDLSPGHPTNTAAAAAAGLHFDEKKEAYVNEEGSLVWDKFGQPY